MLPLAMLLAKDAHQGQVDKAGHPYWGHLQRVAERVSSDDAKAVAWLHDILEDTAVTEHDLVGHGISRYVIDAVVLLTRKPNQSPEAYYRPIAENHLARVVKLADIADNSDPRRLAGLDDVTVLRLVRKYSLALNYLHGEMVLS